MANIIKLSKIEWTDYAVNLFHGCAHGCRYNPVGIVSYGCYAQLLAYRWHMPNWATWTLAVPATTVEEIRQRLPRELDKIPAGKRILLSSMTDPYQPLEASARLTRAALEILVESDKHIMVLTKSDLVLRDMELFTGRKNVEVGCTFTCGDDTAHLYEPGAPLPSQRHHALCYLALHGVHTFASIEPWLPGVTPIRELIIQVSFTKKVILGSLNHAGIDKSGYGAELPKVEQYCRDNGIELLVKRELRRSCSGSAVVREVKHVKEEV